jgi:hypothetical protein
VRRLFCILLMICLPLQAFAWQGSLPPLGGVAHQLDHENDVHHHHDADGSVHYDHSEESVDHVQDGSSCGQFYNLPVTSVLIAPGPAGATLAVDVPRFIPKPFLDGPHRPPANTLG